MTWRTRFAIQMLFIIAEMLSDDAEIASKIRQLCYNFKTESPKAEAPLQEEVNS